MAARILSLTVLLLFAVSAYASRFRSGLIQVNPSGFRGGLIQWKAVDSTTVRKKIPEI